MISNRLERRTEPRHKPDSLTYVRIYYRIGREWVASDELLADISETHLRVCGNLPNARDFRLCKEDIEDFRRATVIRSDGSGTAFEIGEPVEPPKSPRVVSDLSFLMPHYDLELPLLSVAPASG